MRAVASLLLAGSLLSVSNAWAAPRTDARVPLVAVAAHDEEESSGGVPDGCMWKLVCFAPPSPENSTEWITDNKWLYIVFRDLAVVGLGVTPIVSLTLPMLWIPFLFHFLIPEEVRPPISGDLMMGLLLYTLGLLGIAIISAPLLFLPAGFVAWIALNYSLSLWVAPVTLLHLYNTAMKEQGDEQAAPKKKKKAAKKKQKAYVDDDE